MYKFNRLFIVRVVPSYNVCIYVFLYTVQSSLTMGTCWSTSFDEMYVLLQRSIYNRLSLYLIFFHSRE